MLEQELEAIGQGIHALVEKEEIINPGFTDLSNTDEQDTVSEPQDSYEISPQPSAVCNQAGISEADQKPLSTDNRQLITDNHSAIYLAPFYYAEIGVANQFSRLLAYGEGQNVGHSKTDASSANIAAFLSQLENEMRIRFAPQQREAIHTAITARAMILTGGPGTGKNDNDSRHDSSVCGTRQAHHFNSTHPDAQRNVSAKQPVAKPKPSIDSSNSRHKLTVLNASSEPIRYRCRHR